MMNFSRKTAYVFVLIISVMFMSSCTGDSSDDDSENSKQEHTEKIFSLLPAESINNIYSDIDIPQNPGLALNNWNGGHQDSYCSDSVKLTGPITGNLKRIMQYNPFGFTPIMACNSNNQMIGISLNYSTQKYYLIVFDQQLEILCNAQTSTLEPNTFGGGYFMLNNQDNAVVVGNNLIKCYPTSNVQKAESMYTLDPLWISDNIVDMIPEAGSNSLYGTMPVWDQDSSNLFWCLLAGKYNFQTSTVLSPACMAVIQITPDSNQANGCTTTLVDYMLLPNQWNNNTFSVDENGTYIVTNAVSDSGACDDGYLYAFGFDSENKKIFQRWRHQYLNSGFLKSGMKNIGSGTTPTIIKDSEGNKFVTIGDNAYPQMNAVVVNHSDGSLVAQVPVFSDMRSCDEASFIGAGSSIIVENNFGHTVSLPDSQYVANEPGLAKIMLDPENSQYPARLIWNNESTSFFAMSMLCRESGIIFAHTGDWLDDVSAFSGGMYYVSALDAWDGRVIWRVPLGRGMEYCHEYGGIYFDRTGKNLHMGTNSYLISIQESTNQ